MLTDSGEKIGNKEPIIVSCAPDRQEVEELGRELDTLKTEGENSVNNK